MLRAERLGAERRTHARIDAARQPDDRAAPAQLAEHLLANGVGDARRFRRCVDPKRPGTKIEVAREPLRAILSSTVPLCYALRHAADSNTSASTRRRLILPDSVFGSSSRNSTSFGTMK